MLQGFSPQGDFAVTGAEVGKPCRHGVQNTVLAFLSALK